MNEGYLYVANAKYVEEAVESLQSLRKCNPNAHATLITDEPFQNEDFNQITILSYDDYRQYDSAYKAFFLYRAAALAISPYDKTFYIDTDIYFYEDCRELFKMLDYFDIMVAQAPTDVSSVYVDGEVLEGCTPYNMGVIVYRKNEATRALLADYHARYKAQFDIYLSDQPAFVEALLFNTVKLHVLQPFYNFRHPFLVALPPGKVKIMHGRPADFVAFEKEMNKDLRHRVWLPHREKFLFRKTRKLKNRIRKNTPAAILDTYHKLRGTKKA